MAARAKALETLLGPGGLYETGEETWPIGVDKELITTPVFKRGYRTLRQLYDINFTTHAAKTFLVFRDERHTYADFWRRASALANALVKDYGVKPGDRIGIAMRNAPEWLETFVAATSINCIIVTLNSMWKGPELEYGLRDSGCTVLVCDERRYQSAKDFAKALNLRLVTARCAPQAGAKSYNDVIRPHMGAPCPVFFAHPDDDALIMYTSGSTGHPKGVVLSQRGVCTAAMFPRLAGAIKTLLGVAPSPIQECMILPTPLFHIQACHHIFMTSMLTGRKLVIMEKWNAGEALRLIQKERATAWKGVPTMVQDLMEHPDFAKTDTSTLKVIGGGGAPTPLAQVQKTVDRFGGAEASQGYGLTETNGAIANIQGADYVQRPGSTGRAFATTAVLVRDLDTGKILPTGGRGELLIKGPLLFSRYWNKPDATREALVSVPGHGSGWFRTGDVAELDGEGFIYIKDRAKDIIIRGGENISCAEVESAFFAANPEVMEVSSFGLKHERLGEEVGLLIHLKPGAGAVTGAGVVGRVAKAGQLAKFKTPLPENVFFTKEQLPRGATGKILKREIRDKYNKLRPTKAQIDAAKQKAVETLLGPGGLYEVHQETYPLGADKEPVTSVCFKRGFKTLRELYDISFSNHAKETFVVFKDERYTFADFWQRAGALANALVKDYGVKPGDRIGIAMRNAPEWMEAFVAATAINCIAVPLNSLWKGPELEYGLRDSGCTVLVCDERRYQSAKDFAKALNLRLVTARCAPQAGAKSYNDVIRPHMGAPCPVFFAHPDDDALIMYTSGSTGHPKGVVLSQRGVCTMCMFPLVADKVKTMLNAPRVPFQECNLLPVPLFHVTACHHLFVSSILMGRKLVIMEKWNAGEALRLIQKEQATGWTGVPTMVQDLMEHPDFAKTDTSSLRVIGGGGAPTPLAQVNKMADRFRSAEPSQGYGLTETNGAVATIQGVDYVDKPGSTGRAFPTMAVLVRDLDTGKILPTGGRGELLIKGPLLFSRYWNKPDATREALVSVPGHGSGWFRTGDVAELDGEGFIYIKDRAKDIIIRGGENISCAEVESAFFAANPEVMEVSSFGLKHERLGEEVGLLIHLKPGAGAVTGAGVVGRVAKAGQLAKFKTPLPENVFFTKEQLPRGATGKILKREIRDKYNKLRAQKAKL